MADRVDVRLGGRRGGREGRFSSLVCVSMMMVFWREGDFLGEVLYFSLKISFYSILVESLLYLWN